MAPTDGRAHHAQHVRTRILEVAAVHFRRYGYDRTSLAEVGAEVGITRGAVLYHFGSKPRLISELVQPFATGLQEALDEFESSPPRPDVVVDAVLDLLIGTRSAVDLLARDIASRHALDLDEWFRDNSTRLVRLLVPESVNDIGAEMRGYAAIGAMIRPLAHLDGEVTPAVRQAIRGAAIGALRSKD